jgi:hypothetical protein
VRIHSTPPPVERLQAELVQLKEREAQLAVEFSALHRLFKHNHAFVTALERLPHLCLLLPNETPGHPLARRTTSKIDDMSTLLAEFAEALSDGLAPADAVLLAVRVGEVDAAGRALVQVAHQESSCAAQLAALEERSAQDQEGLSDFAKRTDAAAIKNMRAQAAKAKQARELLEIRHPTRRDACIERFTPQLVASVRRYDIAFAPLADEDVLSRIASLCAPFADIDLLQGMPEGATDPTDPSVLMLLLQQARCSH